MTNTSKTTVTHPAETILGNTYYDCRYEDYFTVESLDESKYYAFLNYKRRGKKKEAVSFITYHIDMKQYLPRIV